MPTGVQDLFVVYDDPRRVAEDEDTPDQDVADCGSEVSGDGGGELAEERLTEEGYEGRVTDYPEGGGDEVLVESCRAEEDHHHGLDLGPPGLDQRKVDMVDAPEMDWEVPPSPELLQTRSVPPTLEEHSVGGSG